MNRRRFLATAGSVLAATAGRVGERAASASEQPNEAVQQAREAALKVLKPTPKQLEHGLKLHAESLVFDTYGFAPRAAVDGEALRKAVEAGASPAELQDLREEMSMTRCATDPAERAEFEQAWKAAASARRAGRPFVPGTLLVRHRRRGRVRHSSTSRSSAAGRESSYTSSRWRAGRAGSLRRAWGGLSAGSGSGSLTLDRVTAP
jgi:hypothetical protein